MADTISFDSLLNTTSGMTAIVNNTKHDDDTISVAGVDWFTYADQIASTVYVNGNNWIGFGQSKQQLKICNRDGVVYYIYRQEGVLQSGKKFLKIRVEGYSHYSTSYQSTTGLKYEIFLIEGQTLFINVIQVPSNSSYIGTSSITDGNITTSLNILTTSVVPVYVLVESAGNTQEVSYEKYSDFTVTGISIAVLPSKTTYYQKELFDSTGMVVTATTNVGSTVEITNYSLSGFDSDSPGSKIITVTLGEFSRTFEVTILEETLTGISATVPPTKLEYHIYDTFSDDGIVVSGSTSNGNTVVLNLDQLEYSGFDSSSPGTKTVTVSYNGFTTNFDVAVVKPASISYNGLQNSTCFVGDTVNLRISSINATYNDGITDRYITKGYTINLPTDTSTEGEKIAVINFFGVTIDIPVNVFSSYTAQIGTPNQEYAEVSFDSLTGIMDITGIGEFHPIRSLPDVPSTITQKIKILNIGNGITKIPDQMFSESNISNLETISLPNTLTEIGSQNFQFTKLTEILLPESLTKIGQNCFYGNEFITALDIPGSVVEIGSGTFSRFANLQEITFHEGLETIGWAAFNECPLIKDLSLPSTLKDMKYSFQSSLLDSLEMGGEETIFASGGTEMRIMNISAKNLTIRGGTIYSPAFTNGIEKLVLGGAVKWSSDGQFTSQSKLKNLIINDGVTSIPMYCFGGCSSLESVVLPDSILEIGASCFSGCSSLKNFTLPKKIKKIPSSCFSGCGFETFEIPDDSQVEEIENVVFQNCPNLATVYIGKTVKTIASGGFYGASALTTIRINQKEDSISGSPWANTSASVEWLVKMLGIEVTSQPSKLKYKKGEAFDSSGLTVSEIYSDGTSETVTDYTLSAPDMSSIGSKTVTVTYNGQTATFDITVIDAAGIEITALPDKIRYYENDTFSSDGLIVSLVYTDGSRETVSEYTLSTPDMSTGGSKIVTITYNSFRATFEIKVVGASGIEITKLPTKTEYKIGEEFDISGLVVSVVYADGTKKAITENDFFRTGFDSVTAGEKEVQISYTSGGKSYTATFPVMVYAETVGIRIDSYPSKFYYKIGESLDTSGMQVKIVMADGKERLIQEYTCSGFDSTTAGAKKITVTYTENEKKFRTSFQVRVTKDRQNSFNSGEPINVTVHWINGEFEDLTNENIQSNSLTLQESICSESYFIFGGCVSNQITFQAHHTQFDGTDESYYPRGKIEVFVECKGTKIKIFTGEIDSAERASGSLTRNFIAYDYLYNLRNTDIVWWCKNQMTDKQMILTQKQFRDALFKYLGIEQAETTLEYDNAFVPNTNLSNEINAVNIIKDLCLQNSVFGWMNRDGKFEYLALPENSYQSGTTLSGTKLYKYYEPQLKFDTFKSFSAKEGRIWFPYVFQADPYPGVFSSGEPTAQEAYENNIYMNRNSFFVGNDDWLNYVFDADEYGNYTRMEPIMEICRGTSSKLDIFHLYRAQEYTIEVEGDPLNMVGQTVQLRHTKQLSDGSKLEWAVNSYIMSRTLKLGYTKMIDTYSAKNSPYNGNNKQLGKNTPEISGTATQTRSELPVISYADFSDGTDFLSTYAADTVKKDNLRCIKRIKKSDYDALVAAGNDRTDTLYFTYEEG